MTTPQERTAIRSQLALRWNPARGCYEVYTTIHGSNVFRWFAISPAVKDWYQREFKLAVDTPYKFDFTGTGAAEFYENSFRTPAIGEIAAIDWDFFTRHPDIPPNSVSTGATPG